jgi:hypothetical protein
VFYAVVIVFKRRTRVERRVNINAFNLAAKFLFESFEGEKVIAEDETVIEEVVISHTVRGVMGFLRIFEQDTRLKPGPVLLPDPSEFEFGPVVHLVCG